MDYEVSCPKGHKLRVTEAHFGQQVNCPTCGESFVVPDAASASGESAHAPGGVPAAASPSTSGARSSGGSATFTSVSLAVGRPMLALGLLLVLLSRGCDAIGQRGVVRAKAKLRAARSEFYYQYRDRSSAERDKEEERREKGEWRRLGRASSQAAANNDMSAYWREILFVIGTIILAFGLLAVSWNARGAERWVCLIILAIQAFSIYVAGAAWVWSTIPVPR